MSTREDLFRFLLLFHNELKHVEILPFAPVNSEFAFDGSAGGTIAGEEQLLSFMQAVGVDSLVRIERHL